MEMSLKSGSSAAAAAAVSVIASTSSSSSWIPTVALASAGLAACGVFVLTAMQSDVASRKFLLSPQDLQVKRQNEYIYKWTQALQRAKLQMQYYLAGCGNNNARGGGKRSIAQYQADDEMARTRFVSTQQTEELKELVDDICSGKLQGLRVARIGRDDARKTVGEYYVWLIQQASDDAAVNPPEEDVYQVPLGPFCLLLADAMERVVTATTFCFVSDASAGLASRLVVDLVAAAFKAGTPTTRAATTSVVATVEEPLWMACLAAILEQGVLSSNTSERILFALCRLEAATLAASCASKTATILITLPGQATTATLLPYLQKLFPYDRHVFCYTGCIRTVEHAAWLRRYNNSNKNPQSQRGYIPETLSEVLTISHNPVIHTTPLLPSIVTSNSATAAHRRSPLLRSSSVMPPFLSALKELPIMYADTVETWMTAVDAFLEMKENEKRNGYHPYVLKLDYLLSRKINSNSSTEIKEGTDRYWSLLSLLQYVTGSKSRVMASEQVDAASSWLLSQQQQPHVRYTNTTTAASTKSTTVLPVVVLDTADRRKIEQAVFQHKRILIENKTLVDTVQPKQHWSLKATLKKGGCACCGPEEEEEEEEKAGNTTMSKKQQQLSSFEMGGDLTTGARAASLTETASTAAVKDTRGFGGYVDGKMGFAFDPSKFKVT
jgi:hypothetical protein